MITGCRTYLLGALCLLSPLFAGEKPKFTYLALGDSVAFGYTPLVPIGTAERYTGYPEILSVSKGAEHEKKLDNTACPGETSGSFLSATAPDNQCRAFKAAFGLHVFYGGTQMENALATLQSDKKIALVTVSLGGDDLILLQQGCSGQGPCILAGLPAVLANYGHNLAVILQGIRQQGDYDGPIVLVTYYSPDYRDPIQTGGIGALNAVTAQVGAQFGAKIADGFGAFLQASIPSGGNTCAAGLLAQVAPGVCDVHPSPKGRDLLAATVLSVIEKSEK